MPTLYSPDRFVSMSVDERNDFVYLAGFAPLCGHAPFNASECESSNVSDATVASWNAMQDAMARNASPDSTALECIAAQRVGWDRWLDARASTGAHCEWLGAADPFDVCGPGETFEIFGYTLHARCTL